MATGAEHHQRADALVTELNRQMIEFAEEQKGFSHESIMECQAAIQMGFMNALVHATLATRPAELTQPVDREQLVQLAGKPIPLNHAMDLVNGLITEVHGLVQILNEGRSYDTQKAHLEQTLHRIYGQDSGDS